MKFLKKPKMAALCVLVVLALLIGGCGAGDASSHVMMGGDDMSIELYPYPVQVGENLITVRYPDASPASDKVAIVAVSNPSSGEATEIAFQAEPESTSDAFVAIVELPQSGVWTLEVLASAGEDTRRGSFEVQVAEPPTPALQRAEEFELQDVNGNPVKLSDFQGRPVVLNFWATWCPPCRAEMPLLEEMHQQHSQHGVVLLAINVQESRDNVLAFVEEFGLTFPILLDSTGQAADLYLARALPVSVFISPDGYVVRKHFGGLTPELLDQYLGAIHAPPHDHS